MKFTLISYCFIVIVFSSQVASSLWQNCGSPTDSVKVVSLDIYSDNSVMYVTGRAKVAENLTAPIEASVEMRKRIFWGWATIPCVEQIGSCTYNDVCSLSPYLNSECPQSFIDRGLPCKCPILEGQYAIKKFPVDLRGFPSWLDKGTYRIKLNLKKDSKELLCLLLYITL